MLGQEFSEGGAEEVAVDDEVEWYAGLTAQQVVNHIREAIIIQFRWYCERCLSHAVLLMRGNELNTNLRRHGGENQTVTRPSHPSRRSCVYRTYDSSL